MRYLTLSSVNQEGILNIEKLKRIFFALCLVVALFLLNPLIADAKLLINDDKEGLSFSRSLESLRDLDYQTWQVVAYPKNLAEETLVLRIVGYTGTLRIDHPTALQVHSGLKDWLLKDITLSNSQLAGDPRQAAAEFELSPLLNDLNNNRPLRLMLPGN